MTIPMQSRAMAAPRSYLPRGTALDALFVFGSLENRVDKNAGSVNLVWVELAEVDEFFDFGNDVIGGGGHHGIEIARSLAIDEIAPAIAFPCFDEREIAAEGAFEDVLAAGEFARFFVVGDHGAVARGGVERGDAGTSRAEALAQRALRIQLHLQLATEDKLLEEFVFADVRGDHFLDLALLEQEADAEIVDAGVVADDGEVFRPFAADGGDKILRDATEAEAAHEDGGAVDEVGDGGVGGGGAFVHLVLRRARGVYFIRERSWKTPLFRSKVTRDW